MYFASNPWLHPYGGSSSTARVAEWLARGLAALLPCCVRHRPDSAHLTMRLRVSCRELH